MTGSVRRTGWVLLPALAAVLAYLPALGNGFAWDDRQRILEALPIRFLDPHLLSWAFTTLSGSYWMPLTWISFALDWKLGGGSPLAFHLTNILLHAANSLLVYFLCRKILRVGRAEGTIEEWEGRAGTGREGPARATVTGPLEADRWPALLAAVLFAVHPLHVESVAWATERKDVLYAFFYLAAIILYLDRTRSAARRRLRCAFVLLLFTLSLMSKPMAVTLPFVLLLLDLWPLGRLRSGWRSALLEKIPLLLMAAPVAWVTTRAPAHLNSAFLVGELSWPFRIGLVFRNLVFYAWKTILPMDLSPFYPIPRDPGASGWAMVAAGFLAAGAMTWVAWRFRKERPFLAVGWGFYLLTLAPVLGLVQAGAHAAADRFMYLPILAFLLPFSVLVARLGSGRPRFLAALAVLLTLTLGAATARQCAVWKDSLTVYERIVALHPQVPNFIRSNLAAAYAEAGRLEDALREYEKASNIPPVRAQAQALAGKAAVLADLGREAVAERVLREAIALDPNCTQARRNLWVLYGRAKRYEEALAEIRVAVILEPRNVENREKTGTVLEQMGRWEEAARAFEEGARLSPRDPVFRLRQGVNHLRAKEPGKALAALEEAYRLDPGNAGLLTLIGKAREEAQTSP